MSISIFLSHFVHLSLILQLRLIFIYVTSPPLFLYLSQTQFVENFNITRPNVDAHHRPELPLAATFSHLINIHLIARLIHIQCAISCHVHQPCLIISSTTTHQKLLHKTPPGLPLSFDSCVGQDDNWLWRYVERLWDDNDGQSVSHQCKRFHTSLDSRFSNPYFSRLTSKRQWMLSKNLRAE